MYLFKEKQKLSEIKELEGAVELLKKCVRADIVDNCIIAKHDHNLFNSLWKAIYYSIDKSNLSDSKKGEWTALCHEFGHYVDHLLGRISALDEFSNAIYKDIEIFTELYDLDLVQKDVNANAFLHGLSDILAGTIEGLKLRYKHDKNYYKCKNKLQREVFAHFFEAIVREDYRKLNMYENYLPSTYKCFNDMLKYHGGDIVVKKFI